MLASALLIFAPEIAAANVCTASSSAATLSMGSNSVGAINGGAVAAASASAGLSCSGGLLTIGVTNSVTAKVVSTNNFLLTETGQTGGVTYSLSAGPGGNTPITQGSTVQYMSTTLLGLLGITTGAFTLPIYAQATASTALPAGTYTDTLTITWHWNICIVGVGSTCVTYSTDPTTPATTTTVNLTITVAPKPMTLTISNLSQSDPLNLSTNPKSIPGGVDKYTISARNNDVVAANAGTIALNAPTPANTSLVVATTLQGSSTNITFVDGSPASGMTFSYVSPSSTSDNVDFSSDGGVTWTYSPVNNGTGVDPLVTNVRLRPQGAMAAGSSFSVNLFYMVK